ncbi:MAG: hypothetical protein JJ855_00405 [Rhodospirillales bacterium]|nr:hypothetical protein [Rhodospirillales bacterium]
MVNASKVLIDNCVDGLSDIMEPARKSFKIGWGDQVIEDYIVGYRRKAPRDANETWMQDQIECLPTIARLGKEKSLQFFTYNELIMEAWRRPGSFPANIVGRLFSEIEFEHVDAAVERSRIFSGDMGTHIDGAAMIDFCRFLIGLDLEGFFSRPKLCSRFPDRELDNLRDIGRFRELCDGLSDSQLRDAFHLWTGEVNSIDFFLTTDKKFIRVMTETKRINLPCMPVSPTSLLQYLGVSDRDPFPFKHDQFYRIDGRPE